MIGDQPDGKRLGQAAMRPDPSNGFIMPAKRRSRSKGGRAKQAAPAAWRLSIVLSTAARSLINMTVTSVTSGSVLLCLFAAKRWL
jgi:hypothetical protein